MMRAHAGMILLALLAGTVCAQSADIPPAFEAADVRVSPHRTFPGFEGGVLRGDRYVLRQATMVDLIATANGVDAIYIEGGPVWLETDRFDITAKVPPATPPATVKLMLRSLLQDRFKLVIHNGSKPMPAFVLTTGNGKPKLKEAEGSGDADCKDEERKFIPGKVPYTIYSCRHTTMEEFARNVHEWAGDVLIDPVVDSTGLKGSWDFDIKWTEDNRMQEAGPAGISIFDAVEKQLGLKLEHQTAPRPVLIVDNVNQKPTPNLPDLEKILPSPPPPRFDVATIKPYRPGENLRGTSSADQLDTKGVTLKFLIAFAWERDPYHGEAIVGAPKWLDVDRFDILAKVVSDPPARGAQRIDLEDLRPMLQALLADRFKLKTHMEDRPVSSYTLVAVNPKLKKADPLSRTQCAEAPSPDGKGPRSATPVLDRLVSCQNMTMAQIADEMQRIGTGYLYRPVLDETHLKGSWDFTLSFSSPNLTSDPSADPIGAVSFFDAVGKQLGLKLEKQRRLSPVLVIDHIDEKPTEN
jgi:uncharacterized protein (TIGR03435 family)